MAFKKKKFLALLQERQACFNKTQSWESFKSSDKHKNLELLYFLSLLEDYNFWLSKNEYIQILNNYLHNRIIIDECRNQFRKLRFSNLKSYKNLKCDLEKFVSTNFDVNEINIDYNPKSEGFADLIYEIQSVIDMCDSTVSYETNVKFPEQILFTISENSLKSQLKVYFLQKIESY